MFCDYSGLVEMILNEGSQGEGAFFRLEQPIEVLEVLVVDLMSETRIPLIVESVGNIEHFNDFIELHDLEHRCLRVFFQEIQHSSLLAINQIIKLLVHRKARMRVVLVHSILDGQQINYPEKILLVVVLVVQVEVEDPQEAEDMIKFIEGKGFGFGLTFTDGGLHLDEQGVLR